MQLLLPSILRWRCARWILSVVAALMCALSLGVIVIVGYARYPDYLFVGDVGGVSALAFSHDSSTLAIGEVDGELSILDVSSGIKLAEFGSAAATPLAIRFSRETHQLFSFGAQERSYVFSRWNLTHRNRTDLLTYQDFGEDEYCEISPNGRQVAFLPFPVAPRATLVVFTRRNDSEWSMSRWEHTPLADATPEWDAIVRMDESGRVWTICAKDLAETRMGTLDEKRDVVRLVAMEDGIILGTSEGHVLIWKPHWRQLRKVDTGKACFPPTLLVSDDSSLLVIVRLRVLRVWDLSNITMVHEVRGYFGGTVSAAISKDNRTIAFGYCEPRSYRAVVELINLPSGPVTSN